MRGALVFGLALGGCPAPDGVDDPTGLTSTGIAEICVDAPITTWDNFGAGFVTQHCNACHAATTVDRHGAPKQVLFDTEEDVWASADRILARAAGEDATMPPQGGVTDDDRYRLDVWLSCGG